MEEYNYKLKQEFISKLDLDTLEKARENYGYKNQMLVSVEELNELSCVLTKYGRYEKHETAVDKLQNKVLDEVTDVLMILDHVINIFDITDYDIRDRVRKKTARLRRWMEDNPSFEHTTVDREIKPKFNSIPTVEEVALDITQLCSVCPHESICFSPCDKKQALDIELDRALSRL